MREEFVGRNIEVGLIEWGRWFYVYRYYDCGDVLLYIGYTSDPYTRWLQHRRRSEWATRATTVRIERFAYEDLARSAETAAIRAETPLFNIKATPVGDKQMADMVSARHSARRQEQELAAVESRMP